MCVGFAATAQAQSSVIASSRRIDWSQAGVTGGIPSRSTVCTTLSPGASADQINSAIQNCPSGQVVKLNAGSYNIGAIIIKRSDVTLRGAGPDQTRISFNGADGCMGLWASLCVMNSSGGSSDNPGTVANWTSGYAKGSTSITLSTTSGLSVGAMLVLDQLADPDSDTGDVWVCQSLACSSEGGNLGRSGRPQQQLVKVTAVNGNTVTFTPSLHMPNWRADRTPQAFWLTPVKGVGLEDMSMDFYGAGAFPYAGIFIGNAYDSWVRNVRGLMPNQSHISIYESARVTVRDSYFYGTRNGTSLSYGITLRMSSDVLVENNIFQHISGPMMTHGSGSVWAYNYAIDDYYYVSGWQQASSYFHDVGIDNTLMEGNDGVGFTADNIHGTSNFGTAFRNRWTGLEPGKTMQTSPVIIYAGNRYMNFVGNVLGDSTYHKNYESNPTSGTDANRSIFVFGWSSNGYSSSTLRDDPKVASTAMRWGNYDVVTGTRFNASEVPSSLGLYANSVPSSNTLPASLYLTAKPTWFGSVQWPATGPDVSGGDVADTSGHAHKIPARLCYENTSNSNGILNFNGNTCYGDTSGRVGTVPTPAPPANVRLIK